MAKHILEYIIYGELDCQNLFLEVLASLLFPSTQYMHSTKSIRIRMGMENLSMFHCSRGWQLEARDFNLWPLSTCATLFMLNLRRGHPHDRKHDTASKETEEDLLWDPWYENTVFVKVLQKNRTSGLFIYLLFIEISSLILEIKDSHDLPGNQESQWCNSPQCKRPENQGRWWFKSMSKVLRIKAPVE